MAVRNNKPNTSTKKLTGRQLVFADALARGRSQKAAGVIAGYSTNRSHLSVLANSPEVRDHIQTQHEREHSKHSITLEWWRETLSRVALDSERDNDRTSLLAALRLAGQHLGALSGDNESGNEQAFAVWLGNAAARSMKRELEDSIESKAIVSGTMEEQPQPFKPITS